MLKNLGRPREEHQADAYAFYDSVVKDKAQKTGDRIDAQERIDKLLGLESPQQIEHSGRDGGPVPFMAVLAAAQHSELPGDEHTGNVVDVDAAVARIEAEYQARTEPKES